jgi:hypothetical protein
MLPFTTTISRSRRLTLLIVAAVALLTAILIAPAAHAGTGITMTKRGATAINMTKSAGGTRTLYGATSNVAKTKVKISTQYIGNLKG